MISEETVRLIVDINQVSFQDLGVSWVCTKITVSEESVHLIVEIDQ